MRSILCGRQSSGHLFSSLHYLFNTYYFKSASHALRGNLFAMRCVAAPRRGVVCIPTRRVGTSTSFHCKWFPSSASTFPNSAHCTEFGSGASRQAIFNSYFSLLTSHFSLPEGAFRTAKCASCSYSMNLDSTCFCAWCRKRSAASGWVRCSTLKRVSVLTKSR